VTVNKSFIFAIVLGLLCSIYPFSQAIAYKEKDATIDCGPATPTFVSNEKDPNRNGRIPGHAMKWNVLNLAGGSIEFEFVSKDGGAADTPLNDGEVKFKVMMKTNAQVKKAIDNKAKGSYKYTISCYPADGSARKPIDPIIDIPPK
jgi:hypothetical protein